MDTYSDKARAQGGIAQRNAGGRREERHVARLLALALPIVGMTASRMVMGFIDFAMVSRLGTEAQAAISPATVLVFAIITLGMGAASTVQTFASQADGRGEGDRAAAYAWQSIYIALGLGLALWPLIGLTAAFYGWIARVAGHAPEVERLEIEYTQVALWSFTPSVICAGLNGFFNGIQRPRIGLVAILVSIAANIVGNYLLIFGHGGFPALGVRGAAIATVVAWWVRAGMLLGSFLSPTFDEGYATRRTWGISLPKLAGVVRVGAPASFQWFVDIASWVVFMHLIMPPFGTVAMAASNIGLQFMHLGFMPPIGLSLALASLVGFAIGEGRPELAVARTRVAMRLNLAYMGLAGAFMFLARRPLIGLISDDPAVIESGAQVMVWVAIFQLSDALCVTYTNALRGAGDTRWPALAVGLTCWGIFIGGGFAMARLFPQWGINGPWLMCTLYIVILGGLLYGRFRSGAWRAIRLFEPAGPVLDPAAAAQIARHPESD